MGERRMISRKIVESAKFLKMPQSSQNLYFHLIVNADDDGIVEAYTVIALTHSNEDDLKILMSKSFVYVLNEDLVTYIEDWREQNNLRADRKTDSKYQKLLLQVRPDVNLLKRKQRSDVKKSEKSSVPTLDCPRTAQYNLSQSNLTQYNLTEDKSISQSILNANDGLIDNNQYKKIIANNIELENLIDIAQKNSEEEITMVNEIYETICDMVCNKRDTVIIKKITYPWQTVKSQFLKLRFTHIANILNRIIDGDLKIKNMSGYLISTLYSESLNGTIKEQSDLHTGYLKELRGEPYKV